MKDLTHQADCPRCQRRCWSGSTNSTQVSGQQSNCTCDHRRGGSHLGWLLFGAGLIWMAGYQAAMADKTVWSDKDSGTVVVHLDISSDVDGADDVDETDVERTDKADSDAEDSAADSDDDAKSDEQTSEAEHSDTAVEPTKPSDDHQEQVSEDKEGSTDKRNSTAELSLPLSDHLTYPEDRPEWIRSTTDNVDGFPKFVVVSRPCDNLESASDLCKVEVDAVVRRYADDLVDGFHDAYSLDIHPDWVDEAVVRQRYEGTVRSGDDRLMHESAALLVFDDNVKYKLEEQIHAQVVKSRLVQLGGVTAIGLFGLTIGSSLLAVLSRRVERKAQREIPAA